jgi:hypothetical protein
MKHDEIALEAAERATAFLRSSCDLRADRKKRQKGDCGY